MLWRLPGVCGVERKTMIEDKAKEFLSAAYSLEDRPSMQEFYKQWANDYDEQMQAGLGYLSPTAIAHSLGGYLPAETAGPVIDIGCGTGLVARALSALGYTKIDGLDLSQDMLQVAERSGLYNQLIEADLTAELPLADQQYASAICAGTFTHSHVGPDALDEITRLLMPQGVFAFTVHFDLWERDGFSAKLSQMVASGALQELEREAGPYFTDGGDEGWFCVYRKV